MSIEKFKAKTGCYPPKDSEIGSRHILAGHSVGEKVFYWTGSGWSSNQNLQWHTGPTEMMVLGWSYVKPEEVSE